MCLPPPLAWRLWCGRPRRGCREVSHAVWQTQNRIEETPSSCPTMTKILPKLRSGSDVRIGLEFTVTVRADSARSLAAELQQILQELGLGETVRVEDGNGNPPRL